MTQGPGVPAFRIPHLQVLDRNLSATQKSCDNCPSVIEWRITLQHNLTMEPITDLPTIARLAVEREGENLEFREFVKHKLEWTDAKLEEHVRETADSVWAGIDCTKCANCCRTLRVGLMDEDIARLAGRFWMTPEQFSARYVTDDPEVGKGFGDPPCPFLEGNFCSVYEDRPAACRAFPFLHSEHFRFRQLKLINLSAHCPIVYNTLEELKSELSFENDWSGLPQNI